MNWKAWREQKAVHVVLILLVFTCTGFSVARVGIWIAAAAGFERFSLEYWLLWIFGLLPIYNVLLLGYAFLFGKFQYFRAKQKRTWRFLTGWMRKP
jgi:ABC-type iron transport system FetAB permease component